MRETARIMTLDPEARALGRRRPRAQEDPRVLIMDPVAQRWFSAFMETVKTHDASTKLREAAERGEPKHWTQALTGIVVGTFPKMGWRGAAREHKSELLP